MTADVELLPLYAELQGHPKLEIIKHYARANVAHATAAKDAEIEALRAENKGHGIAIQQLCDRAERLAEALRLIAAPMRPDGSWNLDREACRQIARDALREHDQEVGNG